MEQIVPATSKPNRTFGDILTQITQVRLRSFTVHHITANQSKDGAQTYQFTTAVGATEMASCVAGAWRDTPKLCFPKNANQVKSVKILGFGW